MHRSGLSNGCHGVLPLLIPKFTNPKFSSHIKKKIILYRTYVVFSFVKNLFWQKIKKQKHLNGACGNKYIINSFNKKSFGAHLVCKAQNVVINL